MNAFFKLHDLVRCIVNALVHLPGEVKVFVELTEVDLVTIEVVIDKSDFGGVMGSKGRTAAAIRSVSGAAAQKFGYKLKLSFAETAAKNS